MNIEALASRYVVVKIGGSTLGDHDTTLEDLVVLQRAGVFPVVVHGGGKTVTRWLEKLGVETRFVRGLRVTDPESLDVVIAVLAGLVNKELVAGVLVFGGKAVGLSGVDGALFEAAIRDPALGRVGEIIRVNPAVIEAIVKSGFIPVIATAAFDGAAATRGNYLLNINGDAAAGSLAVALNAARLIFLTDVPGVSNQSGDVAHRLSEQAAAELFASGVVSGGMIPKLEACLQALKVIPEADIVDGRQPHALLRALSEEILGTKIVKGRG